jgi:biotin carboxylase
VKNEEDIREFWGTSDGSCVMKYTSSRGSVGLKVCNSLEECRRQYDKLRASTNYDGEANVPILIQELMTGDEYAVNTVSCEGRHVVTDIYRYRLSHFNGHTLYDSELVTDESCAPPGLLEYAKAVLDATGVANGISHSEFFMGPDGPVLVETNPRMMGPSQSEDYEN